MGDREIVVHVYSKDEFVKAQRIPEHALEGYRAKADATYVPPVEVKVVA